MGEKTRCGWGREGGEQVSRVCLCLRLGSNAEDRADAANGPAQRGNGDPALGSRSQCTSALRLLTTS